MCCSLITKLCFYQNILISNSPLSRQCFLDFTKMNLNEWKERLIRALSNMWKIIFPCTFFTMKLLPPSCKYCSYYSTCCRQIFFTILWQHLKPARYGWLRCPTLSNCSVLGCSTTSNIENHKWQPKVHEVKQHTILGLLDAQNPTPPITI